MLHKSPFYFASQVQIGVFLSPLTEQLPCKHGLGVHTPSGTTGTSQRVPVHPASQLQLKAGDVGVMVIMLIIESCGSQR